MSITQDLRTRARHRGKTPWQLVKTIGRLEREADDNTCQMVAMATEIDTLTADRNRLAAQLDETVIAHQATIDELIEERDGLAAELAALKRRFAADIAIEANAYRIDVPQIGHRDTSAIEDQATTPIDVKPLWQALGIGTVTTVDTVTVIDNPNAADPANLPAA
ncbi:hypothetical protein AAW14_06075 [Streptomyces hygroscopicus]|uniref:hypothetical protein n=1 Tax=Streptomyces hygroscopicus TaxID=1912 RepID=UPI00223FACF0|nr:hypothetical protein [Streptomyces hygroscopicus]MCW7941613.1 hypothetical protein [Streptomyces hygroscopicus]